MMDVSTNSTPEFGIYRTEMMNYVQKSPKMDNGYVPTDPSQTPRKRLAKATKNSFYVASA